MPKRRRGLATTPQNGSSHVFTDDSLFESSRERVSEYKLDFDDDEEQEQVASKSAVT